MADNYFANIIEALKTSTEAKEKRIKLDKIIGLQKMMIELEKKAEQLKIQETGEYLVNLPELNRKAKKELLTAKWERVKDLLDKIEPLDQEKLLLNIPVREVITQYLDRFKVLAGQDIETAGRELEALLDSFDYLIKILLQIGKRTRV